MIRKTLAVLALAVASSFGPTSPAAAAPVTYGIDSNHSEVSFQIRHLVSKVRGRFKEFTATIVRDEAAPANSSVELVIKAASIDTEIERRDTDLRSPNFFDVEKFPDITFKSVQIDKTGEATYNVTGDLTMHGVTRRLTLPVTYNGEVKDPWGGTRAGYSLTASLDRTEFGITWNKALDQGGFLLGDEVQVTINLEAVRK
jgi:polyisoprenoid-binding protein YceI